MNNEQKQFFEFMISKAKLLDLPKLKDLLAECFDKQSKGEFNVAYLTQVAPKLLDCIKDDAKDEVGNIIEEFKKKLK